MEPHGNSMPQKHLRVWGLPQLAADSYSRWQSPFRRREVCEA
jgi:hypothetical protein